MDVARAMAAAADHRTGRDCRPGNGALAAAAGYSERQVQRCRNLLARLGFVVETLSCANGHDSPGAERGAVCPAAGCGRTVSGGKNYLSLAQRLVLWRAGSRARVLAARFTLTVPRDPQAAAPPVDDGDLSVWGCSGTSSRDLSGVSSTAKTKEERSAHSQPRRAGPRPVTMGQVRAGRLRAGVQRAVSWLTGVSPVRLRCLDRFAAHGWTEGDVVAAIGDVLRARNWAVPAELEQGAAYLALLLRDVDAQDRPGALDQAREQAQARQRFDWALSHGRECAHGKPGGDVPRPSTGRPTCPLCRAGS
jgi:hypothetical protein